MRLFEPVEPSCKYIVQARDASSRHSYAFPTPQKALAKILELTSAGKTYVILSLEAGFISLAELLAATETADAANLER